MSGGSCWNTYILLYAKFALASDATHMRTTEHVDTNRAGRDYYDMKKNILIKYILIESMVIKYSPGLRPIGVPEFLVNGLTVKGSYFQLVLGTSPVQKLHFIEQPDSPWRPSGAPRLDC